MIQTHRSPRINLAARPAVTIVLLLAIAVSALGADIRQVQVGDRYYVYKVVGANDLVEVRFVDYQNNRVKVMYQNGGVDWVSPTALMSKSESDTADVGTNVLGAAVILGGLYCLANPKDCRSGQPDTPTGKSGSDIFVTVVNEHCNSIDYFQNGSRVVANLAPASRQRFQTQPGERRVWACNSGTSACSEPESVAWFASRDVRVGRSSNCDVLKNQSAWNGRPLIEGNWINFSGTDADMLRAYIGNLAEPSHRELVNRTNRLRCIALPFYRETSICEGEVRNSNGDSGIATFVGDRKTVRLLDGNSSIIHELNSRSGLVIDTEAKALAYLRFFTGGIQAEGGTFEVVDSLDQIGWTVPEAERPRTAALQPTRLQQTSDGWVASTTVCYSSTLYRANFRLAGNGTVEMTDDAPLLADLPALKLRYVDGVRYRVR